MMTIELFSADLLKNSEFLTLAIAVIFCISTVTVLFFDHLQKSQKETFRRQEHTASLGSIKPSSPKPVYTVKDMYILTMITVLYGLVSLWKLGNIKMPVTTWQPSAQEQAVILELWDTQEFDAVYTFYGEGDNNANPDTYQIGYRNMIISGSDDAENWEEMFTLDDGDIYRYTMTEGRWNYRYIRIFCPSPNATLSEIAFRHGESFLPVSVYEDSYADTDYPAGLMIDEQDRMCLDPTYQDMSYFDEVYHPRNAWEIAEGQYMYASVHPLLGTNMIALSIRLLGNHPLAWRLPGAVTGILLIPLFYALCKEFFRGTYIPALTTALSALDFMHITTSRIATLEPFSVFFIVLMYFFMVRYFKTNFYDTPWRVQRRELLLCGIAMGLGIATKWTACYSAVGLAVLFFVNLYRQYRYAVLGNTYQKADLGQEEGDLCEDVILAFRQRALRTILWCILCFIIIPVVIYFAAYLPDKVWRDGWSISNVIDQIRYIYTYHIDLEATHPYQSTWWQWLLDIRPIWYYHQTHGDLAETIACFSNPLITWTGLVSITYTFVQLFRTKSQRAFMIAVGYLSTLLPWVIVQRCVFAYHFYPTSFFMILSIGYMFDRLIRKDQRYRDASMYILVFSLILFIIYLPVITGFMTTPGYIKLLEIFPSWYFG